MLIDTLNENRLICNILGQFQKNEFDAISTQRSLTAFGVCAGVGGVLGGNPKAKSLACVKTVANGWVLPERFGER